MRRLAVRARAAVAFHRAKGIRAEINGSRNVAAKESRDHDGAVVRYAFHPACHFVHLSL
jgi:hypothetical protein